MNLLAQETIKFAAIIVNRNRPAGTIAAIESLKKSTIIPDRIIVVENGSDLRLSREIHAFDPTLTILHVPKNLGFAGGNNRAISKYLASFPFFFLLNNDALVFPDTLPMLFSCITKDPRIGVVGSTLLDANVPNRLQARYGVINYRQVISCLFGAGESIAFQDIQSNAGDVDVDYVLGCGMLIRRSVFLRIGLFDEHFFAYHEDLDFCVRARKAGFRVVYAASARIFHEISATTHGAQGHFIRNYLLTRNSFRFMDRHGTWFSWIKFLCFVCLDLIVKIPLFFSSIKQGIYTARCRGFWDGLVGRKDGWYIDRWLDGSSDMNIWMNDSVLLEQQKDMDVVRREKDAYANTCGR